MTVTEIAKLAGVSIGTVDRVLHNRGHVSETTQKKIMAIIKQSGFQPDPLARHLKKHIQYHIGVLMPEIESGYGYWQQLFDGIKKTAENELSAFSFTIVPFPFRRPDQKSLEIQFNNMVNSYCCAYIIAPVMQEETKMLLSDPAIDKPYCFVDSPLPGCKPVSTIAQNPYKAGFFAGRITELVSRRKGIFAVLEPFTQAYNQNERAQGFCDWFKTSSGGNTACRSISSDFTEEGLSHEVGRLINETPDLAGICTVSVEVQFIAQYLKNHGYKKDIAVSGFDLVQGNCINLKNGAIDFLIDQEPREQGRLALQQLFKKLVYEEEPDKDIAIPLEIFFKENLL